MIGFGWFRTHLGVFFSDAFGLLWGFWLNFWKRGRNQQIWANFEVLRRGVGIPRSNVGPHQGVACPRRGMAERGLGQASGTLQKINAMPRRRSTLQHSSATPLRSYYS